MKHIFKKILQAYLKFLAKLVLLFSQPVVIAVAGSVNKTFVKEEITRALDEAGFSARSNYNNFNTEIGLPLAILNISSGYNSYSLWLPIIWKAWLAVFKPGINKFLVLEMGVSDIGDMKYLLSIVKPEIAVITDITQRYLEGFNNMDELVGEYDYLVKNIRQDGLVVLNYDNPRIRQMSEETNARVVSYGLGEGADWQAIRMTKYDFGEEVGVKRGSLTETYKIERHGEHHIYALLAGLIIKDYAIAQQKKI